MKKNNTEVELPVIPPCAICDDEGRQVPAVYDARTRHWGWGYLCENHFREHGVGLGLGKGQRIVLRGGE